MQISDIDLKSLKKFHYKSKWIEQFTSFGRAPPRAIFRDEKYFYKIWDERYIEHKILIFAGERLTVDNRNAAGDEVLLGYLFGLYDNSVCPAFVDHIYDGSRLAGYRTLAGEIPKTFSVEESASSAFIQQFIQRSLRSGFVHRDFKRRNVIKLPDGRLSLIDLEAPIVALAKLKRRSKSGTRLLPTLIHKYYPEFIHSFIDGSTRDPEILSARRRWKTPPPFRIILSESGPAEAETKIVRVADVKEPPLIGGIRLPSGEVTPGRRANGTLRRRNAVVASSFDLKGKRVLDVGCSHGLYSLSMARVADEVVGIDHRISKIELGRNTAEKLGIKNVTFDYGDVRDPNLLKKHGKFDLIIAWGFLHRVSDLFSLLYGLEPLSDTISFEWRTPIIPLMSTMSIAYHPPFGPKLDPMNVGSGHETEKVGDAEKIEGGTAFWEPTIGAVSAIMKRLGYEHSRLLGFDDKLQSEERTLLRYWYGHQLRVNEGKARLDHLPRARVHMIYEKQPNSITLQPFRGAEQRFPEWDYALQQRYGVK